MARRVRAVLAEMTTLEAASVGFASGAAFAFAIVGVICVLRLRDQHKTREKYVWEPKLGSAGPP